MRAARLLALVATAAVAVAQAQFSIPATCAGRVTSLSQVLSIQPELQANCPAGATTCSSACRTSLAKVRRRCGKGAPAGCLLGFGHWAGAAAT